MRIRTEQIKEAGRHYTFSEPASAFPVLDEMEKAGECRFYSSVAVELTAAKEMDCYRITGSLLVPVGLCCSRCLADFEQTLSSRFTFFFHESRYNEQPDEEELELAEQDLVSVTFQGDEIDLLPEIGEQAALSIPLKPLCSDLCKGLCPVCGADNNKEACNCGQSLEFSKFSALRNFKVNSNQIPDKNRL